MKLLFSFFKSEATVKMSAGRRSADGSPRFYARALLCCSFFPLLSRVFFFLFFWSLCCFSILPTHVRNCLCVCVWFFFCKSPHHQYVLDSKLSLSLSLGYLISARGITTVFCFFCVFFFLFLYLHAFRYCCCCGCFSPPVALDEFYLAERATYSLGFLYGNSMLQ